MNIVVIVRNDNIQTGNCFIHLHIMNHIITGINDKDVPYHVHQMQQVTREWENC